MSSPCVPLSEERIEELKALDAKATQGPWECMGSSITDWNFEQATYTAEWIPNKENYPKQRADAALIVAMRNVLPQLLADRERSDREWLAMMRALVPLATAAGDPDEWHEASDGDLRREFDPWSVIKLACSELSRLREDAARLDWLSTQSAAAMCSVKTEDRTMLTVMPVTEVASEASISVSGDDWQQFHGQRIRDAIDAARRSGTGDETT